MPTLFTRIIEGEIPATFVWRDDEVVAFMSIEPLRRGHTLVVPVQEVDHWLDCPAPLFDRLMEVSQTIGKAIHAVFGSAKVGLMVAGLEVPHLHLHVVPMNGVGDLDFGNVEGIAERDELDEAADAIRHMLRQMGATGVIH